jgi:hypothetical protein
MPKPNWMSQDDYDSIMEPHHEYERREAAGALGPTDGAYLYGIQQLNAVQAAKERAIEREDFEQAKEFRAIENKMTGRE